MFAKRIGVDLGTAYTLVTHANSESFLRIASSIALDKNTRKMLAYGDEARLLFGRENQNVEVIQPLKDGVISDLVATNLYLNHLIDAATKNLFAFNYEVFVCVPWGATSVELKSYAQGLKRRRTKVHLVREPFAASLGCGREILNSQYTTIIDMGGGTTEIATIYGGMIVAATSLRAGGNFCDEVIQDSIRSKQGFEVGFLTAEDIKKTHGSVWPLENEYSFELKGSKRSSHLPDVAVLHTEELRSFLEPYAVQVEWGLSEHLRKLPDEAKQSVKYEGIYLAGGGSLIPGWKDRIQSRLEIPVQIGDQPTHCVIRGLQAIISDPVRYAPIIRISEKVYSS